MAEGKEVNESESKQAICITKRVIDMSNTSTRVTVITKQWIHVTKQATEYNSAEKMQIWEPTAI